MTPEESHPINFLTLSQCFLTTERSLASYPLLRLYLIIGEKKLYVSTQIPKEKRDQVIEDYIHKDDRWEERESERGKIYCWTCTVKRERGREGGRKEERSCE